MNSSNFSLSNDKFWSQRLLAKLLSVKYLQIKRVTNDYIHFLVIIQGKKRNAKKLGCSVLSIDTLYLENKVGVVDFAKDQGLVKF